MATAFVNLTIGPTETYVNNGSAPSGGSGYQDRFTVGGTWAPNDTITITLTNNTSGLQTQIGAGYVTGVIPTYCFTFNEKVYALASATAYFSAVNDATTWNNPTGNNNGFVELSDWYATAENLVAAAPYQGKLAFFSRFTTQIYNIDADPLKWAQQQVLTNIGTLAPFSVQNLGDLDVMFLNDTGFRSLRARDLTLNAFVNDLGSPIDSLIQANISTNGVTSSANAQAVVDPQTGRYWCWLNNAIYVFSYYPTNQIVAWSTYDTSYDAMSALLLTATAATTSQINLVWGGAVSDLGAITYALYRSTLSGFFPTPATLVASELTGLTYSDTGLTDNTTYYYYVIGTDVNGGQILSNEANATTPASGSGAPGPFTLTATTISQTEIDLSWTTPAGSGITYNVYGSTNPSFTPGSSSLLTPSPISVTTFNNTGLLHGTYYYYYVIATNVSGSSTSNEANARTIPDSAPLIPFMTSDTAPSGTASAISEIPGQAGLAYLGFQFGNTMNGTFPEVWYWNNGYWSTPLWLQYQFPTGQQAVVTEYAVMFSLGSYGPGAYTANSELQGSNDGVSWTTVDTQTLTPQAGNSFQMTFTISPSTAYQYWRINITSTTSPLGYVFDLSFQLSGYIK